MATDLNETSTHEDIQEAVDQIVEDRKSDEQLEEKGDAQTIAEDNDQPVTQDTEEDTTADEGEDTGESEGQDWLDDELKAEVTAYGIEEAELADFANREELERAMRLFDKTALEAGRKAMADDKSTGRDDKGRFTKSEPTADVTDDRKIGLDPDIYDEELIAEFGRQRDYYESRIADIEERFQLLDAKAEEQQFDSLVDGMGHTDLFGKSGKENPKQLERRKDLYVAAKAQLVGLQQLGRDADLNESLVNRVARMVFAEELGKKELKARTRKVSKQSNKRMGGSATKAHDSTPPLREEMRQLYKELEG